MAVDFLEVLLSSKMIQNLLLSYRQFFSVIQPQPHFFSNQQHDTIQNSIISLDQQ